MSRKRGVSLAALAAAALLVMGCQPLANIGEKVHPSDQRYIKLSVTVPPQARAIAVTDYQVTGLEIEVLDPNNASVKSISWDAAEGDHSYMLPVEMPGDYVIKVTHIGEKDGQTVEATESATFTIGAMMITVIEITPGQVGMIKVVGGTTPPLHTLSGKLVDGSTGAPIAGGIVEFGGHSATSGADGSYSLDLGQSPGTVNGTFSIRATGYTTFLFGIPAEVGSDSTANWILWRIDNSGLPGRDLNLHIYELQSNSPATTEIPDGTTLMVSVVNENGAAAQWGGTYSGGYTWVNTLGGQSCVVSVYVDLAAVSPMHSFNVIKNNVSLTGASQDLSLYEDPSNEMTVSITGDAAGNNAALYLDSPNGVLLAALLTLDGSALATLDFLNPYGYEGFWTQLTGPAAFACSTIGPITSYVTLPAVPDAGAVSSLDPNTLAYDSGTLAVGPVAGVDSYGFWLYDGSFNRIAMISSLEPTITLPTWMQSQLAGTTATVMVYGAVSNLTSLDFATFALMLRNAGAAPSVETVVINGGMKALTF